MQVPVEKYGVIGSKQPHGKGDDGPVAQVDGCVLSEQHRQHVPALFCQGAVVLFRFRGDRGVILFFLPDQQHRHDAQGRQNAGHHQHVFISLNVSGLQCR